FQPAQMAVWCVDKPHDVANKYTSLSLHPSKEDQLKVSYTLDYGLGSPLGRQTHTQDVTPEHFANGLAGCRTFILEEEAAVLRRQGLGARTTAADLLVFGRRGPIGNRLRHANEPARHK